MPSLWDLLCVSRQHKYTTHARSKRRPQEAWEEPPYYDPSNVEYYIQPDLPSRRRTDSLPSQASAQLVHVPPPRSPSARRNHKVRESPRPGRRNSPAWYVEVRVPQSPSSLRDDVFYPAEGPPLLNRQESRPVPGYSAGGSYQSYQQAGGSYQSYQQAGGNYQSYQKAGGSYQPAGGSYQQAGGSYQPAGGSYQQAGGIYQYSGRSDLLDRDYAGSSSGKRRHVKDIFADVSNQYQDDRYQPVTSNTMSASSTHSPYSDQVWQPNPETSASKDSLASAAHLEPKQTPRSRQISAHIQSSGYTLPTESRHNSQHSAQPWHNSRYPPPAQPRQASGYPPPAKGSWQSASGLVPPTGPRPGSRSKPPESMHQYSPRTVSDGAISAALLGSRIDDFVHDPGWNRAIDKFAPSPTSTSVFPFEDKSFPRSANRSVSSQRTLSPKDSDGNVTFVVAAQPLQSFPSQQSSDDSHTSDVKTTPQASTTTPPVLDRNPERSPVHNVSPKKGGEEFSQDVATRHVQSSGNGYHQTSTGSGQEIQMFLGAEGDVLY